MDKQKRDKKRYHSNYDQGDPTPRENIREEVRGDREENKPRHASNRPEQQG